MPQELPKFIDPQGPLKGAGMSEGRISPTRLARIAAPYTAKNPTTVHYRLDVDEGGLLRISGQVKTEIGAVCQRCLEGMTIRIERSFDAVLVDAQTPGSAELSDIEDVVTMSEGRFDIEQFVEDEVILACPMIPLHDNDDCRANDTGADEPETRDRIHPFAELGNMLGTAAKRRGRD